jgi:hypothetical protein
MGAALVWVLVGGFLFLSFVTSAGALLFLRAAAIRRREDDEIDARTWSRERWNEARRARWLARGTGLRDLPPTGTHHRIA